MLYPQPHCLRLELSSGNLFVHTSQLSPYPRHSTVFIHQASSVVISLNACEVAYKHNNITLQDLQLDGASRRSVAVGRGVTIGGVAVRLSVEQHAHGLGVGEALADVEEHVGLLG